MTIFDEETTDMIIEKLKNGEYHIKGDKLIICGRIVFYMDRGYYCDPNSKTISNKVRIKKVIFRKKFWRVLWPFRKMKFISPEIGYKLWDEISNALDNTRKKQILKLHEKTKKFVN